MRIGIDIQSITGKLSGIGFYTKNLLQHLKSIDSENEYIPIFDKFFQGNLSTYKRVVWEQIILPSKLYTEKIDILHIPGFSPPLIKNCRLALTLHDLIGVRIPENNLSLFSRLYWGKYLPILAKTVDIIITVSQHSKYDIMELLKIDEKNIVVIYLAAGKEFRVINDEEGIKNVKIKYNIAENPYVLYVGNIEYRKNLFRLVKVWESLSIPYKLVIVGSKTKFSEMLMKYIVEKNLKKRIVLTGYVPINDLVLLYNGASLFVYPSLYEGFGLPVIEAMSCGVPVVTSNTSALPEVVGDAGIMVNPLNSEELQSAIIKVLTDNVLHRNLRKKGLERAKMFSWEKTAKETLKVYKMLM
ncbi:MAG: glycosyltransferase family 1 protein [Elusimicrobiota bacterium]|nr:glycosyltransferase family 4 protein [Endomicrobiia bacterium]MDW8166337.1 glycosyltransferase family 1 protein [Elusimicrobiota bacterium]